MPVVYGATRLKADGTMTGKRLAALVGLRDLARRVPVQGDDDLSRLAMTLNRMLDRIGALMESLRQVTSDVAHDLRTPLNRLRQRLERSAGQADDPAHNTWFTRDPAAIAAAKGIGAVAPFYVEQESPVPPGGLPQPGKLVVQLRNAHLGYAITWYGLAVVLVAVFAAYVAAARRKPGANIG